MATPACSAAKGKALTGSVRSLRARATAFTTAAATVALSGSSASSAAVATPMKVPRHHLRTSGAPSPAPSPGAVGPDPSWAGPLASTNALPTVRPAIRDRAIRRLKRDIVVDLPHPGCQPALRGQRSFRTSTFTSLMVKSSRSLVHELLPGGDSAVERDCGPGAVLCCHAGRAAEPGADLAVPIAADRTTLGCRGVRGSAQSKEEGKVADGVAARMGSDSETQAEPPVESSRGQWWA
jgi:hypothetical protein